MEDKKLKNCGLNDETNKKYDPTMYIHMDYQHQIWSDLNTY